MSDEPEAQAATTGQQRRENMPQSVFVRAAEYAPMLSHAVCGQVASASGAADLARLLRAASSACADGRWLVGDMLVVFLRDNLETQGVVGGEQVQARLDAIIKPPRSTAAIAATIYLRDMGKVCAFVRASIGDDFDTAMTLIDAGGDAMLMLLASLVAATCPVHPLPLVPA